MEFRTCC